MTNYRFRTVWWTPGAIDRIWEALADYAKWPTWWRGIRSVEVVREGDASGTGTILRQQWRSWVPYTLVFDLEMLRIESQKSLEGRASGDLEGVCRWTFAPVNGGTEIRFNVDIRTGRWWMNLPVPFASRIVQANFEAIMRWGREGLARKLGAPVKLLPTESQSRRPIERMAPGVSE